MCVLLYLKTSSKFLLLFLDLSFKGFFVAEALYLSSATVSSAILLQRKLRRPKLMFERKGLCTLRKSNCRYY